MHAQRVRRHGSVDINLKGEPVRGLCSIDGCDSHAYCKTLCHGHYRRLCDGRPLGGPIRPRNAPTATHKKCPSCEETKTLDQFNKNHDRVTSWCKKCLRYSQKKHIYGLSRREFDELTRDGCAICGATGKLVVDHCHTSGSVRSALCANCNVALGMAGDSPSRLRKMAEYLESHLPPTS